MVQAFPRYCPRCGTPTRANMRLCPTCGLSTTAMLRRSRHVQGRSNKNGEMQAALPEAARVAPSAKQMQHESQPEPMPPTPSEPQPWTVPPDPQHSPVQPWPEPHPSPILPEPQRSPVLPVPPDPQPPMPSVPPDPQRSPTPSEPQRSLIPPVQPWPVSPETQRSPMPPAQQQVPPRRSAPVESWRSGYPVLPPFARNVPRQQSSLAAPVTSEQKGSKVAPPGVAQVSSALGKRRAAIVLILLALLLIMGAGGYLAATRPGGLGTSQAPFRTVNLHIPITYAGISITLLNVQQAQNFADDPQSTNDGMVRLHLQERNATTIPITWSYADSARLLVRDRAAAPVYVQSAGKIAPGARQSSVLDFAVPKGIDLSAISLQLGASDEAQMRIPLTSQANLGQYQTQIRQQHGNTGYFGLNWMLTSSTTNLSIPGQQAARGMEYLTLSVAVDNPLSQEVISGSPFDYARVKIDGKTFAPVSVTLPVSFASGAKGKTGALTFLIPQNSTAGTFLLLSQDSDRSGQASIDFSLAQNPGASGQVSVYHHAG